MKANSVPVEYVMELLEHSELSTDCQVCADTKKKLYAIVKKETVEKYR